MKDRSTLDLRAVYMRELRKRHLGYNARFKPPAKRRSRPSLTMPQDPALIGYITDLIDGEGCITIRLQRSDTLSVCITTTSPRLARWLSETFGGFLYNPRKRHTKKWKMSFSWNVHAQSAGPLLKAVQPYLIPVFDREA